MPGVAGALIAVRYYAWIGSLLGVLRFAAKFKRNVHREETAFEVTRQPSLSVDLLPDRCELVPLEDCRWWSNAMRGSITSSDAAYDMQVEEGSALSLSAQLR